MHRPKLKRADFGDHGIETARFTKNVRNVRQKNEQIRIDVWMEQAGRSLQQGSHGGGNWTGYRSTTFVIFGRHSGSNGAWIYAPSKNCSGTVPSPLRCGMRISPRTTFALDSGSSAVRATGTGSSGRQTGDISSSRRDHKDFRSCKPFAVNARDGGRTRTPLAGLRILSPVRLPVPPPRLIDN